MEGWSNHVKFINLMTSLDEIDRETFLRAAGYRKDTEGTTKSQSSSSDRSCICHCSRCLCVLFEAPNAGSSGCGAAPYETIITWKKRTAVQVKAITDALASYNDGLYQRANYVRMSSTGAGFALRVPLRYLHTFFALPMLWPAKRLLNFELRLSPSAKTLIKDDTVSADCSLHIIAASLDISYVVLESSIRSAWYSTVHRESIVRTYPSVRETHFTLQKNSTSYQLQNIIPFGHLPRFFTLVMNTEKAHVGDYSPRFCYMHRDLVGVQVFTNGSPWYDCNRTKKLDFKWMDGADTNYFYHKFLRCFPKNARHVSLKRFHSEFFVLCFDIAPLFTDDQLSLVTNATVDIQLEFKQALTENLILYVHAYRQAIIKVGEEGDIVTE